MPVIEITEAPFTIQEFGYYRLALSGKLNGAIVFLGTLVRDTIRPEWEPAPTVEPEPVWGHADDVRTQRVEAVSTPFLSQDIPLFPGWQVRLTIGTVNGKPDPGLKAHLVMGPERFGYRIPD